jgi:hypothetical protein
MTLINIVGFGIKFKRGGIVKLGNRVDGPGGVGGTTISGIYAKYPTYMINGIYNKPTNHRR